VVIVPRETMQLNANKNHSHLAAIRGYRSVAIGHDAFNCFT
jgi:hypothetical protein